MKFAFALACLMTAGALTSAQAQTCEQNVVMEGVPMMTKISFKTWQEFPRAKPATALDNIARAVAADGYSNIQVDKSLGAINAIQETSGSGRVQNLRIVVRKKGAGSRVDAVFTMAVGQVTSDANVRQGLCPILRAAND